MNDITDGWPIRQFFDYEISSLMSRWQEFYGCPSNGWYFHNRRPGLLDTAYRNMGVFDE